MRLRRHPAFWNPFSTPLAGVVMLAILTYGCQTIGEIGPFDSSHPHDGTVYQGLIILDGGEMTAALEIQRLGNRGARGALQTSSGLLADGEGQIRGETLTLTLVYGGECPGRLTLEGEWDRDDLTFEGIVRAFDCTGPAEGTFRFSAGSPSFLP